MSVTHRRCLGFASAVLALALVTACGAREPYACTAADQCVQGGLLGICEQGSCAFADPSCDDGFRFESGTGDGLAGTCATMREPDAGVPDPPCGEVGQACCAGSTCSDGACTSGTCESCVADVSFGRRFGCVLKTTGTVWCSGLNLRGQLGAGTTGEQRAMPLQVRDASAPIGDATVLAVGREHACAARAGGAVSCWGANESGQLGNGGTTTQPSAVGVIKGDGTPLTGIVELRAGYHHTCGREAGGALWCWGRNEGGELGDGTVVGRSRAAPVRVAAGG
nr:hypothetical protein [Myxococcota bacterium]